MASEEIGSNKQGFGKVLQKKVTRTKEKVLQNLGKADKTTDTTFEQHVLNFTDQQASLQQLQKELKRYMTCVRDMSIASHSMYSAFKDAYEVNWPGSSDVVSAVDQLTSLWEDYMVKLMEQLYNPLTLYLGQFVELKVKISKRGRKLIDYDVARHNYDTTNAKRGDQAKLSKVQQELADAKHVYDIINTELHSELPSLHNRRMGFVASFFNSLLTSEVIFQQESAKVKESLVTVMENLQAEGERISVQNDTASARPPMNRSQSVLEASAEPSYEMPDVPRSVSHQNVNTNASTSDQNEYFVMSGKLSPHSVIDDAIYINGPQQMASVNGSVESPEISSSPPSAAGHVLSAASSSKECPYELAKDFGEDGIRRPKDNEPIYTVPTSNRSIKRHVNSQQILFRVKATHAYTADDADEMSFEPGQVISVIPFDNPDEQDEGWLMGIKDCSGEKGVFPENFTLRL